MAVIERESGIMYKDPDKQREAQRDWVRQKRASKQGSTEGSTKRGKDIKCFEDLPKDVQATINRLSDTPEDKDKRTVAAIKYQHLFPDSYEPGCSDQEFTRLMAQAGPGHIRVSKPGDPDYVPQCETTRAFIEGVA